MKRMVALLVVAMIALAGPASAQGGCKAFGEQVASETRGFHPFGNELVRTLAPANDDVSLAKRALCQPE